MFITLEGPEGSGKTSQIGPLAGFLRQQGYDVLTTREPGGTSIGDQIRVVLHSLENTAMHPRTETLLFQAARAQLVEQVIRPHLQQGGIVISDRYADSTLAYQGFGHGLPIEQVQAAILFATGGLKPDLTLLLDLDVVLGLQRRSHGGEWNRLDAYAVDFHRRVRQGYHHLAQQDPQRWVIVDAAQAAEQVQTDIRKVVAGWLKINADLATPDLRS
jgi:dTMP kinase